MLITQSFCINTLQKYNQRQRTTKSFLETSFHCKEIICNKIDGRRTERLICYCRTNFWIYIVKIKTTRTHTKCRWLFVTYLNLLIAGRHKETRLISSELLVTWISLLEAPIWVAAPSTSANSNTP